MFVEKRKKSRSSPLLSKRVLLISIGILLLAVVFLGIRKFRAPPIDGFKSYQALFFAQSDGLIDTVEILEVDSANSRFKDGLWRWYPLSQRLADSSGNVTAPTPLKRTFQAVRYTSTTPDGARTTREMPIDVVIEGQFQKLNLLGPEGKGFPPGTTEIRIEYSVSGYINQYGDKKRAIINATGNPFATTDRVRIEFFPPPGSLVSAVGAIGLIQRSEPNTPTGDRPVPLLRANPRINLHPTRLSGAGTGVPWVVIQPRHVFGPFESMVLEVSW